MVWGKSLQDVTRNDLWRTSAALTCKHCTLKSLSLPSLIFNHFFYDFTELKYINICNDEISVKRFVAASSLSCTDTAVHSCRKMSTRGTEIMERSHLYKKHRTGHTLRVRSLKPVSKVSNWLERTLCVEKQGRLKQGGHAGVCPL